jgi:hypothetical protein
MLIVGILCCLVFALAPPAPPAAALQVDAALTAIEVAGAKLQAFTADVAYRKDDALLGGGELRTGDMVYERRDDGGARLAIRFEYRIDLGDMARRRETKRVVFDKGWLVESDESQRQFIKRQIVKPGDTADPMRLGGPFPLPIGQKRADVLRRFSVIECEGEPDSFAVMKGSSVIGLHLVPLPDSAESKKWAYIDLWYDRETWLPVGVRAVEDNGDTRRIRLTALTPHETLSEAAASQLSIDPPEEGWSVDVQPWSE